MSRKVVSISREEKQQVKQMFNAADVNGDGTIDLDELHILLRDLGFSEEQILSKAASIMKLYDSTKGKMLLDRGAFVKLYAHFKEKESARLAAFCKDLTAIAVTKAAFTMDSADESEELSD